MGAWGGVGSKEWQTLQTLYVALVSLTHDNVVFKHRILGTVFVALVVTHRRTSFRYGTQDSLRLASLSSQRAWHSSLIHGTVYFNLQILCSVLVVLFVLDRIIEFGYGTLFSKLGTLVLKVTVALLFLTHGTLNFQMHILGTIVFA